MPKSLHLLIGTKKGAFIFDGDADRKKWSQRGPFCDAWPINHVIGVSDSGTIHAAGGNEWFGPAVWTSADLGTTWSHSSEGLRYEEGNVPAKAAWSLASSNGRLFAGIEPAGLFVSEDDGATWRHIGGLRDHPSREHWMPGGGGLILHHIVPHPSDDAQIWIAISAAGVFHTADAGATWSPRNKGTRQDYDPNDKYPEFGQCVHSLVMAPGIPDRLYQQNHCGMYVSENGGQDWISMEKGLPSTFGFPAAAHPGDPDTIFLVPLNGDIHGRYMPDGKAAVWRSKDRGGTWADFRNGLPQGNAYFNVLRQALATDPLEPAGVYFGTSSGSLYASSDEGENWSRIAEHLPTITSVETLVVGT